MALETKRTPYYQEVDGFRLPSDFSPEAFRNALKYQPKEDDLFVVTYPKCGTTWTQQILFLLYNRGQPTEDPVEFWKRTPFLEALGAEFVEQMTRPGAIKTHLPFHMTPYSKDAKYIHVVRNPKDALVSFFHHTRSPSYKFQDGSFDDYFEVFMNGETDYGDYFDHLLSWYEHRNDPNVSLLIYEEMKVNPAEGIKKIAKFVGKQYEDMLETNKAMLDNVITYSSVDYMKTVFNISMEEIQERWNSHIVKEVDNAVETKSNLTGLTHMLDSNAARKPDTDSQPKLIRKGIIGDWNNILSEEQNQRMDERIEKKLKNTELYSYWKSIGCI